MYEHVLLMKMKTNLILLIRVITFFIPLSPEGGWIFTPPWKNVFFKSWFFISIKRIFENWVNQWLATNICYILIHKSNFFETFLNDLQTVSIECQKRLKKVGILRVKGSFDILQDNLEQNHVIKRWARIYWIYISLYRTD